MTGGKIDHLIINSPYEEPKLFWKRDERTGEFFKESGRRPAGYVVANPESTSLDDPGQFIPIELVEAIRPRVKRWREAGYPGATGTTRKLLEHWWNIELRRDTRRFFFCQLDAIENSDLAHRSTCKRTHRNRNSKRRRAISPLLLQDGNGVR